MNINYGSKELDNYNPIELKEKIEQYQVKALEGSVRLLFPIVWSELLEEYDRNPYSDEIKSWVEIVMESIKKRVIPPTYHLSYTTSFGKQYDCDSSPSLRVSIGIKRYEGNYGGHCEIVHRLKPLEREII